MRLTTNLCIVFCYLLIGRLVNAKLAVKFSKKEMSPSGNSTALRNGPCKSCKDIAANFDKFAYPQPLPSVPVKKVLLLPYTNLYQGLRYKDDMRVFRKKFDYEAKLKGQQITCSGIFDCVISHIAIESSEAIPVLLRGGAGYRHFTAIVKAKPHYDLKGQVRAYCRNKYAPLDDEEPRKKPRPHNRRFFFEKSLIEEEMLR